MGTRKLEIGTVSRYISTRGCDQSYALVDKNKKLEVGIDIISR